MHYKYLVSSVAMNFVALLGNVAFSGGTMIKKSVCQTRDAGSIPGSGRSPGGENGNPLQYFCLVKSMDRGTWWALALEVTKSQRNLSN